MLEIWLFLSSSLMLCFALYIYILLDEVFASIDLMDLDLDLDLNRDG